MREDINDIDPQFEKLKRQTEYERKLKRERLKRERREKDYEEE